MSGDIIADALSAIKNASLVKKAEVVIPYSKLLLEVANILKNCGYIENFKEITAPYKRIKIYLRYEDGKGVITEMKRISKQSRRVYVDKEHIPTVLGGYGVAIISTSQGVLTDREAKKRGVGGEVICYVW